MVDMNENKLCLIKLIRLFDINHKWYTYNWQYNNRYNTIYSTRSVFEVTSSTIYQEIYTHQSVVSGITVDMVTGGRSGLAWLADRT